MGCSLVLFVFMLPVLRFSLPLVLRLHLYTEPKAPEIDARGQDSQCIMVALFPWPRGFRFRV